MVNEENDYQEYKSHQNQNSLLVKRQNDNHSPGPVTAEN